MSAAPGDSNESRFSDVARESPFYEAILYLAEKGTITGYPDGSFKPEHPVTRAEVVSMLAKDLGLTDTNIGVNFKDIQPNDWFYNAVANLTQKDVIGGYENGTFRPEQNVTRAELVKLLVTAYGLPTTESPTSLPYKDVTNDSWFIEPLQTLANHDITFDITATHFRPNEVVNRGEITVLLFQIHQLNTRTINHQTIEAIHDDTITISGHTYELSDSVKTLLSQTNEQVLNNAEISFETENNKITTITFLELKPSEEPATLDGGGATIDGDLVLQGISSIKNINVSGTTTVAGSTDTIVFKSSELNTLTITNPGTHVKAEGNSTIETLSIEADASFTGEDDTSLSAVTLANDVENFELNASADHLLVEGNTDILKLTGTGTIHQVDVEDDAVVKLLLNGTIKILKVAKVEIGVDITVSRDTTVDEYDLPSNVRQWEVITEEESSGGSGGGGSSSSEGSDDVGNDDNDSDPDDEEDDSEPDDDEDGDGEPTDPDDEGDDTSDPDDDDDDDAPTEPEIIQTEAPHLDTMTIINTIGAEDILTLTDVPIDSIVKLYKSESSEHVSESEMAITNTVTFSGLNLGKEAGSIWVTLTSPSKSESERTKVDYTGEEAGASGFALNKDSLSLAPGNSETLTAALNLPDITIGDVSITWTSLDDEIASVTAGGVVTAHEPGTVLIRATATLPGGDTLTASCELTIYEEKELELTEGTEAELGPPQAAPLKVKSKVKLDDKEEVNVIIGLPEVPANAKLIISKLDDDIPTPPEDAPFIGVDIAVQGFRSDEQFRVELDIPEGLNEDAPGAYHYNGDTGIWEYRQGSVEDGKFVFNTDLSPVSIYKRVLAPTDVTVTQTDESEYTLDWSGSKKATYYKVYDETEIIAERVEDEELILHDLDEGMHYFSVRAYREEDTGADDDTVVTFESPFSNVVPLKVGAVDDTIYISDFTISPQNLVLDEGDSAKIHAFVTPTNATEPLLWTSTNPFVATVDPDGTIIAKGKGSTTIYVHPLNNPSTRKVINVVVQGEINFSVTPTDVNFQLAPGEVSKEIPVEAIFQADADVEMLDVVFAFDTTGSMSSAITAAKTNAIDIMNLIRTQVSDAQFGVVSFEDYAYYSSDSEYGSSYGGGNDDPYMLDQIVTDEPSLVQAAINKLYAYGGADGPESYTRVLYELSDQTPRPDSVRWRPDAKKIVVLFGDNVTHDLEFAGKNTGEDPGRDGVGGTADDLRFVEVVNSLRNQGIIVLAVNSSSGSNSTLEGMSIGYLPKETETWEGTEGTFGKYVYLNNSTLPVIVDNFVKKQAEVINSIKIVGRDEYEAWLKSDPTEIRNVSLPTTSEDIVNHFDLYIQPPEDTVPGDYEFKADVMADGVELGTISIKVTVPEERLSSPTPSVVESAVPAGAKITLSAATPEDSIYYTLNGTEPTPDSDEFSDGDFITITKDTTVKAIAVREYEDGTRTISDVLTKNYTLLTIDAPTADPEPTLFRSRVRVNLQTNKPGARIYYTRNGTEPTPSSEEYRSPISISNDTTIKAIAVYKTTIEGEEFVTVSEVATLEYVESELSTNDELKTLKVGGKDLLSLEGIEVYSPEVEAGATVMVGAFADFVGLELEADDTDASVTVKRNDAVIPKESLASLATFDGDTIIVTVTAEDGLSSHHYKVTFKQDPEVVGTLESVEVEAEPPLEDLEKVAEGESELETEAGDSEEDGDVEGDVEGTAEADEASKDEDGSRAETPEDETNIGTKDDEISEDLADDAINDETTDDKESLETNSEPGSLDDDSSDKEAGDSKDSDESDGTGSDDSSAEESEGSSDIVETIQDDKDTPPAENDSLNDGPVDAENGGNTEDSKPGNNGDSDKEHLEEENTETDTTTDESNDVQPVEDGNVNESGVETDTGGELTDDSTNTADASKKANDEENETESNSEPQSADGSEEGDMNEASSKSNGIDNSAPSESGDDNTLGESGAAADATEAETQDSSVDNSRSEGAEASVDSEPTALHFTSSTSTFTANDLAIFNLLSNYKGNLGHNYRATLAYSITPSQQAAHTIPVNFPLNKTASPASVRWTGSKWTLS